MQKKNDVIYINALDECDKMHRGLQQQRNSSPPYLKLNLT